MRIFFKILLATWLPASLTTARAAMILYLKNSAVGYFGRPPRSSKKRTARPAALPILIVRNKQARPTTERGVGASSR